MSDEGFVPLSRIRLPGGSGEHGRGRPGLLAVLQAWSQVVRPPLSERARPCGWRQGVLVVAIEEPRWRAAFEILEPALRAEINARLGAEVVRGLRVRSGAGEDD